MSRPVPAATATLRLLRFLSTQPGPVPADRIAHGIELPRSSTYHLLDAMAAEGFVLHYPEEHRWGLGVAAYEVGSGYARHQPVQRLSRQPLSTLVDRVGQSAHLVVLHGRDVLYLLEERARGRPSLVTEVGVRLPASLTASGRAILATLPAAQIRALYPDRSAFVERHGSGPMTLSALRTVLLETRRRGYAWEEGEVTPGFGSVSVAVTSAATPSWTSIAVTFPSAATPSDTGLQEMLTALHATAREIGRRLHG